MDPHCQNRTPEIKHQLQKNLISGLAYGGAMHEPEGSSEGQFDVQPSPNPEQFRIKCSTSKEGYDTMADPNFIEITKELMGAESEMTILYGIGYFQIQSIGGLV